MAKYIVVGGPIEHGVPGEKPKVYVEGEEISLTSDQAAQLLELGEVAEASESKTRKKSGADQAANPAAAAALAAAEAAAKENAS